MISPHLLDLHKYQGLHCKQNTVRPESITGNTSNSSMNKKEKASTPIQPHQVLLSNIQTITENQSRNLNVEGPPTYDELKFFHDQVVPAITNDLFIAGFENFNPKTLKLQSVNCTGNRETTFWDATAMLGDTPYYLAAVSSDFYTGRVIRFEGATDPNDPETFFNNPLRLNEHAGTLLNLSIPKEYQTSVQNTLDRYEEFARIPSIRNQEISPQFLRYAAQKKFKKTISELDSNPQKEAFGPIPIFTSHSRYQSVQTSTIAGLWEVGSAADPEALWQVRIIYDFGQEPGNPQPKPAALYQTVGRSTMDLRAKRRSKPLTQYPPAGISPKE